MIELDHRQFFQDLRTSFEQRKTSARQGLALTVPAEGQLHRTEFFKEHPDWFWLVLHADDGKCTVIPGSLNGMMAGPEDLVLPETVMGSYVFLAMNLKTVISEQRLGVGFAELDKNTLIDVKAYSGEMSPEECKAANSIPGYSWETAAGACTSLFGSLSARAAGFLRKLLPARRPVPEILTGTLQERIQGSSYSTGLPWISDHDERIAVHDELRKLVHSEKYPVNTEAYSPSPVRRRLAWGLCTVCILVIAMCIENNFGFGCYYSPIILLMPRPIFLVALFIIFIFSIWKIKRRVLGLACAAFSLCIIIYIIAERPAVSGTKRPTDALKTTAHITCYSAVSGTKRPTDALKTTAHITCHSAVSRTKHHALKIKMAEQTPEAYFMKPAICAKAPVTAEQTPEAIIYSPRLGVCSSTPQFVVKGIIGRQYTLQLEENGWQIGSTVINGSSVIEWFALSRGQAAMKNNAKYTIRILHNGKKIGRDLAFWRTSSSDDVCKVLMQKNEGSRAIPSGQRSIALGWSSTSYSNVKSANSEEKLTLKNAKILLENQYYSEALLLLGRLCVRYPQDQEYMDLFRLCCTNLSLNPDEVLKSGNELFNINKPCP